MTFNEYQDSSKNTAKYSKSRAYDYLVMGLCGEAGEVANKYKKIIRDQDGVLTPEAKAKIADELGDVLWYLARLANELGYDLEHIAKNNIAKLISRNERGVVGGDGDNR